MTNDLDNGLIYYRFQQDDGTPQVLRFDHQHIAYFVQDQIADRLVYRDRVLCVCRAQLDRDTDGALRVVPRLSAIAT